jgi:hypothetical protein
MCGHGWVRGNADRELVAVRQGQSGRHPPGEMGGGFAGLDLVDRRLVINPGSVGMPGSGRVSARKPTTVRIRDGR